MITKHISSSNSNDGMTMIPAKTSATANAILLYPVYTIQPVVKRLYKRSNRLYNCWQPAVAC